MLLGIDALEFDHEDTDRPTQKPGAKLRATPACPTEYYFIDGNLASHFRRAIRAQEVGVTVGTTDRFRKTIVGRGGQHQFKRAGQIGAAGWPGAMLRVSKDESLNQ